MSAMEDCYKPPFEITDAIANLTLEICQLIRQFQATNALSKNPKLRKKNRIKSIYSSLSIEHNSLTENQVTAVINGIRVIAPQRDILEVQNACSAYEGLPKLNPYNISDLLHTHALMMRGLSQDAGYFRARGVGVYKGSELIHMGTRPEYVPSLMQQLISWTQHTKLHPLIKSCIFHYEFEYIHPFSDGNGRMGRLWHTLILSKWEPLFAWLPIESLIYERQKDYYKALATSDNEGKSTKFIEFMLTIIRDVLKKNVGINSAEEGKIKKLNQERLLDYLENNPKASAAKMALELGLSSRQVERILASLKKEGYLQREGSNKTVIWKLTKPKEA